MAGEFKLVREFGGNGHAIAEFKADRPFFGISKVIRSEERRVGKECRL